MRCADPSSRELLASVDASRWEVLWRLRLPSALPSLFTAARYNVGLALIVAYLAEGGNRRARRDRRRAIAATRATRCGPRSSSMAMLGTIGLMLLNAARACGDGLACVTAVTGKADRIPCTSMADLDDLRSPNRPARPRTDRDRRRTARRVPASRRREGGHRHAGHPAGTGPRRGRRPAASGPSTPASTPTSPSSSSACCSPRRTASRSPATGPTPRPRSRRRTGESRSPGSTPSPARVDHVVVAVDDLEPAMGAFSRSLRLPRGADGRTGTHRASAAVSAGGVTARARRPRGVAQRGPLPRATRPGRAARRHRGAQRRLRPRRARRAGAPLLTEVVVDDHGHEQFFAVQEPAAGVQLGFISRTGHRVGVGAANVLALFDAHPDDRRREPPRDRLGSRTTAGALRGFSQSDSCPLCTGNNPIPHCKGPAHVVSPRCALLLFRFDARRRVRQRRQHLTTTRSGSRTSRRRHDVPPRPTTRGAPDDRPCDRRHADAAVPRRPLRGQQGRRHDHLPVELRLRRVGVDRRRARGQAEGLLRRPVPRRRGEAQLLDRQLPADRRQRRPVLVGRLVQRGGRLRRPRTTPASSRWPSRAAPASTR